MKQVGGDYGDPIAYGGLWRGSDGMLYYLWHGTDDDPESDDGFLRVYTRHESAFEDAAYSQEDWEKARQTSGETRPLYVIPPSSRFEMIATYFGFEYIGCDVLKLTPDQVRERFVETWRHQHHE